MVQGAEFQPDKISIHAPTWGATHGEAGGQHRPAFQSTHPRGVRLDDLRGLRNSEFISIHAPTWGATTSSDRLRERQPISIHAPTWGATSVRRLTSLWLSSNFNPRTHVGCDLAHSAQSGCDCLFQSTHPRGVRQVSVDADASGFKFQSTHPRGVRRSITEWLDLYP